MKRFKHVRQLEETDCGPTCISMVLLKYETKLSIETIRSLAKSTITGTTALGIKKCFEELKFDCDVIRADRLPSDSLYYPLIVHVINEDEMQHYQVIHSIKDEIIIVSDPSANLIQEINYSEFVKMWTGVLIIAKPSESYKKQIERRNSLLFNLKLYKTERLKVIRIIAISILLMIIGIASALYYQIVIDYLIPQRKINNVSIISLAFMAVFLFQVIIRFIRSNLLLKLNLSLTSSLMVKYINHILKLPIDFFHNKKTGDILSRFLDISTIIETVSELLLVIFIDLIILLGMSIVLINYNFQLFLISIISIPIYAYVIYKFYYIIEQKNEKEIVASSKLNSIIIESIKGIENIKIYNNEQYITKKIANSIDSLVNSSLDLMRTISFQEEIKSFLDTFGSVLLLWWGSYSVIKGYLTLGQMISFNSFLFYFTNPLKNIINLQNKLQTAKISNTRLSEIMNLEEENSAEEKKVFPDISGGIVFQGVSFGYKDTEFAVQNISFELPEHQSLAIVGKSGSGKSTIARLLIRFHLADEGVILIGNNSIESISINNIRRTCTYVSQESFFYSGTIKSNIIFGMERDVSEKELIDSCNKASIYDFIKNLPNKFDTIIEEGGTNLSTGQRQRLAIARALIRDNKIIIFDEATSSLDPDTEKSIVEKLIQDNMKTLIFISHRLDVAKMCDSIIVVDEGKIIEKGSHFELVQDEGVYAKL